VAQVGLGDAESAPLAAAGVASASSAPTTQLAGKITARMTAGAAHAVIARRW